MQILASFAFLVIALTGLAEELRRRALVNAGQQITREEALRLYTVNNGWFLHEEAELGSIEAGKLGDLVVLSGDYFDRTRVSDEGIRSVESVLTVVDGKVVHNTM